MPKDKGSREICQRDQDNSGTKRNHTAQTRTNWRRLSAPSRNQTKSSSRTRGDRNQDAPEFLCGGSHEQSASIDWPNPRAKRSIQVSGRIGRGPLGRLEMVHSPRIAVNDKRSTDIRGVKRRFSRLWGETTDRQSKCWVEMWEVFCSRLQLSRRVLPRDNRLTLQR